LRVGREGHRRIGRHRHGGVGIERPWRVLFTYDRFQIPKIKIEKERGWWGGGNFLQPKGQDNLSRGKNILASAQIDRSAVVVA
jgi:hypothetical protein